MDDGGGASATGRATPAEKSAEGGAAVVETKEPGTRPTFPAAVSGSPASDAVGTDAVGGEISSSRSEQGRAAVGEQKRKESRELDRERWGRVEVGGWVGCVLEICA